MRNSQSVHPPDQLGGMDEQQGSSRAFFLINRIESLCKRSVGIQIINTFPEVGGDLVNEE
ncbi:hypothetical protein ACN083_04560 [Rothia sp. CCM 9418]|uniref:hypothetical protein n=1 Tax=Rothia sp. CCM 9418 TaxID=3402661 RepID=UPI003AE19191